MHVRHVSTADAIRETYMKGIENAMDNTTKLKNMAHILSETFVKWDEAIDMAWGCNASPGVASQIGENIKVLVPEIKSKAKPTALHLERPDRRSYLGAVVQPGDPRAPRGRS